MIIDSYTLYNQAVILQRRLISCMMPDYRQSVEHYIKLHRVSYRSLNRILRRYENLPDTTIDFAPMALAHGGGA